MDSLSQIVLGAAVGEVVLGRRIGNRAMVWGAVAGMKQLRVLKKLLMEQAELVLISILKKNLRKL